MKTPTTSTLAKVTFEKPLTGRITSQMFVGLQMGQPQVFIEVSEPDTPATTKVVEDTKGVKFEMAVPAVKGTTQAVCITRSSFWNKETKEGFWAPLGITTNVCDGWAYLAKRKATVTFSKVNRTPKSPFMLTLKGFGDLSEAVNRTFADKEAEIAAAAKIAETLKS